MRKYLSLILLAGSFVVAGCAEHRYYPYRNGGYYGGGPYYGSGPYSGPYGYPGPYRDRSYRHDRHEQMERYRHYRHEQREHERHHD